MQSAMLALLLGWQKASQEGMVALARAVQEEVDVPANGWQRSSSVFGLAPCPCMLPRNVSCTIGRAIDAHNRSTPNKTTTKLVLSWPRNS